TLAHHRPPRSRRRTRRVGLSLPLDRRTFLPLAQVHPRLPTPDLQQPKRRHHPTVRRLDRQPAHRPDHRPQTNETNSGDDPVLSRGWVSLGRPRTPLARVQIRRPPAASCPLLPNLRPPPAATSCCPPLARQSRHYPRCSLQFSAHTEYPLFITTS